MLKSVLSIFLLMVNASPLQSNLELIGGNENQQLNQEQTPQQPEESNPIEIQQTNLSLELYSSVQLQVSVNTEVEDYTVSYTSMDPTTASVTESGFVEAIKVGITQILVSTILSEVKYEKIVDVVVYPIESSISFEKERLDLVRGEEIEVKYTTSNPNIQNRDIVWNSSNPSIATVENSKVKALKFGKVTITATIGESVASMEVSVRVPLDKIEFNPSNVEVHIGNQMPLPALIFVPFDTSVKRDVEYSSSNTEILDVIDGNIIPKSVGSANVIAKVGDVEAVLTVMVKAKENEFGAAVIQFNLTEIYEARSVFTLEKSLYENAKLVALNVPLKEALDALENGRTIELIVPASLTNNNFKMVDRLTLPAELLQAITDNPLNVLVKNSNQEIIADYTFNTKSSYSMNLKYSVKKILASSELGMLVDGPSYELKFEQSIFPENTVVLIPTKSINSSPSAMHFIYHLSPSNIPNKNSLETVEATDTFQVKLGQNRYLIAFNAISNSNDSTAILLLSLTLGSLFVIWGTFILVKRNKLK